MRAWIGVICVGTLGIAVLPGSAAAQSLSGEYVFQSPNGPVTLVLNEAAGNRVTGMLRGADGSQMQLQGELDAAGRVIGTISVGGGTGWFAAGIVDGRLLMAVAEFDPSTGQPDMENGWSLTFERVGGADVGGGAAGGSLGMGGMGQAGAPGAAMGGQPGAAMGGQPGAAMGGQPGLAEDTPLIRQWRQHLHWEAVVVPGQLLQQRRPGLRRLFHEMGRVPLQRRHLRVSAWLGRDRGCRRRRRVQLRSWRHSGHLATGRADGPGLHRLPDGRRHVGLRGAAVRERCDVSGPRTRLRHGREPLLSLRGRKMRHTTLLIAAALVLLPARLDAQTNTIECGGLDRGYQAWVESGATAAVTHWIADSPISNGDDLIPVMGHFEAQYGKIRGYEVIRDVKIGRSLRRIYVMALHDVAPTFAFYDCYRTGNRWTVTNIRLNADGEKILPAEVHWTGSGTVGR